MIAMPGPDESGQARVPLRDSPAEEGSHGNERTDER